MTDDASKKDDANDLLKVLTAHYKALVAARSDETILRQYEALLRALKSRPFSFLEKKGNRKEAGSSHSRPLPTISEDDLRKYSLDELERLVAAETTSRRDLELIAIQRFSVPRGSMRSFSDRQMLVEKLRTLIGNERTHETIGIVARGQEKKA